MSEMFDGYERQYCELSTNLSRKCANLATLSGEKKKQKLAELNTGLDEAESLIRKMDIEARGLQPNQKSALIAKLREYKSDLNNLKKEVKKSALSTDHANNRDELLEAGLANTATASVDQRQRLLMSTERLNQTGGRIKESKRVMLETEEIGVGILQDLHQQRQTLLRTSENLHGVDDHLGRSKRILKNMSSRMSRNKWIMGGLIGLLLLVILLVLYFKLK